MLELSKTIWIVAMCFQICALALSITSIILRILSKN